VRDNMTCIFHFFFAIKIFQFSLEIEQEDKVIMSLLISFDRYITLIRSFPSILYYFEEEINNFEIFKISK